MRKSIQISLFLGLLWSCFEFCFRWAENLNITPSFLGPAILLFLLMWSVYSVAIYIVIAFFRFMLFEKNTKFKISLILGIGYILLKQWKSIDSAPAFFGVVMTGILCGFGLYIGMCLVDVLSPPKKEETPKPEIPGDL